MSGNHYLLCSRLRYLRAHLRLHHKRTCRVALHAGIGGEATYHASELVGWHSGVSFACAVLLVVLLVRVLSGEV